MPTMTKRVNVRATVAVRNTNPPIYGTYKNIIMTTGDILKCLTKRATVDEILPDGSTIRLNYKNYYTDNGAGLSAKSDEKIITPKHSPVVKKATPAENVKVDTDIAFNEASITNTDEETNAESKTSTETTADIVETEPAILVTEEAPEEKTNVEGQLDTLKDEEGNEVDVPAGDLNDEPAEIKTEEKDTDENNAELGVVEDNIETVKEPVTESTIEDSTVDKAPTEETDNVAPKASPKKKSTSSKKKK